MRYLITTNDGDPFLTNWFDAENNFRTYLGMVVYDLDSEEFTTDGENWKPIKIDHL